MNQSFSLKKYLIPIAGLFLLILFFAACKKDSATGIQPPAAGLMAVNLIPESTPIGVAIGGNSITRQALNFNNYTGGYQSVFTGNRTLESYDFNTGQTIAKTTDMFKDSTYYTVFVMGANETFTNVLVEDNFEALSKSQDSAYIRFVNAIPDSSNSTVSIMANGANVFDQIAKYQQVSSFKPVKAGDIAVSVKNESTIDKDRTLSVENGKIYTILLTGLPGATDENQQVSIKMITNGSL